MAGLNVGVDGEREMENEGKQRTAGVIKGAVLGRGMPVDATLQLSGLCHLGLAYALAHRGVKRQEFDRCSCFAMRASTRTRRARSVLAQRRRALCPASRSSCHAHLLRRGCSPWWPKTCSSPTHDLEAGVWRWLVVTFSKIRAALLISVR
jgi:hypothetical protein